MDHLTKLAVKRAGGATALSARIGVSRQAVRQWKRVPLRHLKAVEEASGVSRRKLRPDVCIAVEPATETDFRVRAIELAIQSGVASADYLKIATQFLSFLKSEPQLESGATNADA